MLFRAVIILIQTLFLKHAKMVKVTYCLWYIYCMLQYLSCHKMNIKGHSHSAESNIDAKVILAAVRLCDSVILLWQTNFAQGHLDTNVYSAGIHIDVQRKILYMCTGSLVPHAVPFSWQGLPWQAARAAVMSASVRIPANAIFTWRRRAEDKTSVFQASRANQTRSSKFSFNVVSFGSLHNYHLQS